MLTTIGFSPESYSDTLYSFLVPRIKNHLSSFELGFLKIFLHLDLLRSLSLVLFLYSATNVARKNVQKTTFDSTSEMADFSQS